MKNMHVSLFLSVVMVVSVFAFNVCLYAAAAAPPKARVYDAVALNSAALRLQEMWNALEKLKAMPFYALLQPKDQKSIRDRMGTVFMCQQGLAQVKLLTHEEKRAGHAAFYNALISKNIERIKKAVLDMDGCHVLEGLDISAKIGVASIAKNGNEKGYLSFAQWFRSFESCDTPLCFAIRNRLAEVTAFLLDHNALVNVNGVKDTALHKAAWVGDRALLKTLIARGATVDAINDSDRTPLEDLVFAYRLADENTLAMVDELLKAGADPRRLSRKAVRDGYLMEHAFFEKGDYRLAACLVKHLKGYELHLRRHEFELGLEMGFLIDNLLRGKSLDAHQCDHLIEIVQTLTDSGCYTSNYKERLIVLRDEQRSNKELLHQEYEQSIGVVELRVCGQEQSPSIKGELVSCASEEPKAQLMMSLCMGGAEEPSALTGSESE